MSRSGRTVFLIIASIVALYALIFPVLTVDTLVRVFDRARVIETRNLLLLIFLEASRLVTTLVALAVALHLLWHASDDSAACALALFLLFGTITYEKLLGGSWYPGYGQERVANALVQNGVSQDLLRVLFGPLAWTVWPALAALVRFSAVFPRDLDSATLGASGSHDRRGILRGSGVAGSDVGAFFRRVSEALLAAHVYRPKVLAAAAVVLTFAHLLLETHTARYAGWIVAILIVCIAIVNLRAAYLAADAHGKARINWITEACLLALFMLLLGGAGLTIPLPAARMAAFLVVMLIPPAVIGMLALSVLGSGGVDSAAAIQTTMRAGLMAVVITLLFGVLFQFFGVIFASTPAARPLAGLAAAAVAVFSYDPIRRAMDRLRLGILEQNQQEA